MASANFLNAFSDITPPVITAATLPTSVAVPSVASQTVSTASLTNIATAGSTVTASTASLTSIATAGATSPAAVPSGQTTIVNGDVYQVDTNGNLIGAPIVVNGSASSSASASATASSAVDARLRISALPSQETQIYGANSASNILTPLYATGGLMFPYTPSISVQGESSWEPQNLVHTNFDILSYQRTPSATIGIAGKFTVQNQREGQYAMAVIHFLRVVTKMHFGDQDSAQNNAQANASKGSLAGLPPPVLRLRGYGNFMFNDLRCVVKGYSFNFDEQMDLIPITNAGGTMYLPPLFTLNITIGLQQSPRKVRKDFNLDQFRTGALLTQKGGYWF